LFDSAEFYRPLDVDALLSELDDGQPAHQVCRERVLQKDRCVPLTGAADLAQLPDYIDLRGRMRYGRDARTGTDLITDARSFSAFGAPPFPPSPNTLAPSDPLGHPPSNPPGGPPPGPPPSPGESFCKPTPDDRECDGGPWSRLYYHLHREGSHLLHIDYWWYFRFNVSPVKTWAMCLSGFSVTELSCFDHESDWEGITVTVPNMSPTHESLPEPVSVTYAGHHWAFKFPWPDLVARWNELRTSDPVSSTHPRVYVAFGSHASYPLPCDAPEPAPLEIDRECWQGGFKQRVLHIFHVPVPDGRRDGMAEWSMNDDALCGQVACLSALPTTRLGEPARWNAYAGRWGRAECTFGLRLLCVRSAGPQSPFFQARYKDPGIAPWGRGLGVAKTGSEVRAP
jgi:hypothetical protein